MVTIFYKWLLGDDVVGENEEQDDIDIQGDDAEENVCYISQLPLLRELTDALPPEPNDGEEPHILQGGL